VDLLTLQGDVNGDDTQPIWKYLKENAETPVQDIDWVSGRAAADVRDDQGAAGRGGRSSVGAAGIIERGASERQ
jgi:hypothetical protein